jgi:formylglycine-generating enzyme required for sulfatase activity/DNA-binding winged helix-turn-helix (wHTH) protein
MGTPSGAPTLYRFAEFEFHAGTGELHAHGRSLPLPEQACRVLMALLGSDGEVVSREELHRLLWPDRAYGDFEGGLNTAVCKLRQVLADDGAEPRIIGTLPRRGYRLLVPVEKASAGGRAVMPQGERLPARDPIGVAAGSGAPERESPVARPEGAVSAKPFRSPRRLRLAGGLLLLSLVAGAAWLTRGSAPEGTLVHRLTLLLRLLTGRVVRNPLGMEFVKIPAGRFHMGWEDPNSGWMGGSANDKPSHLVILTQPILMQTTEVTVGQFQAFVKATNYRTEGEMGAGIRVSRGLRPASAAQGNLPEATVQRLDANWRNPYFEQEAGCPVVGISWNDAQAFLAWLNEQDPGKGYRLPTEAEWEYACRGGREDIGLYGPLDDIAWHQGNSGFRTHPVAGRLPNAFGLYDMLGNAREWCEDWYVSGYPAEPSTDPKGPSWGTLKVTRGGAWHLLGFYDSVRPTCRLGYPAATASDDLGFRVVAVP